MSLQANVPNLSRSVWVALVMGRGRTTLAEGLALLLVREGYWRKAALRASEYTLMHLHPPAALPVTSAP
jgi:hypothetical protein